MTALSQRERGDRVAVGEGHTLREDLATTPALGRATPPESGGE